MRKSDFLQNTNIESRQKLEAKNFLVKDFLLHFSHALAAGNMQAITQMWGVPSYIIGNEIVMALTSQQDLQKLFASSKEQSKSRGIASTHPSIQKIEWVNVNLAMVNVCWSYLDSSSNQLAEEIATYTLKMDESGEIKIYVALMHGSKDLSAVSSYATSEPH